MDVADLPPGYTEWPAPADLDPAAALARSLAITAGLVDGAPPDPAVARAARLLHDPQARAEDVADEVGLSPRQLRRRCHAAVGYGPKTLQRVLRFRRFVSLIDALSHDLAGPDPAGL